MTGRGFQPGSTHVLASMKGVICYYVYSIISRPVGLAGGTVSPLTVTVISSLVCKSLSSAESLNTYVPVIEKEAVVSRRDLWAGYSILSYFPLLDEFVRPDIPGSVIVPVSAPVVEVVRGASEVGAGVMSG